MKLDMIKELSQLTNEGVIYTPGEDPEVLVKGVGRYKLSSLEKNLRSKLKDLAESAGSAKDAHAWGQIDWKLNHAAMHEMIKTVIAAYKELEDGKEKSKDETK